MIKRVKNNNYTGYILYAYLGNKKQTIENDQSGFDGSTWFGPASLDYIRKQINCGSIDRVGNQQCT